MNKDHIKGTADKASGKVKDAASQFTGSTQQKAEGTSDQIKGAVKNAVGNAKDAFNDVKNAAKQKIDQVKR